MMQLLCKRHIGNDIVTVIFQDPEAKPFCAKNIQSQFQHVFVVVRCLPSSDDKPVKYKYVCLFICLPIHDFYYLFICLWSIVVCHYPLRVSVTQSYDVPFFGPPIPKEGEFDKNEEFRNFYLPNVSIMYLLFYKDT